MVLSGRSLTMEETPAEEVDNAEPWGTKADFPRVPRHKSYVYMCVCIHIVGYWCLFRKIEMPNESHRGEARCDAKLTRRRLGALACLLAGEYYLLYRIVAWSSMMETGRAARKPFGKLDEFIESDIFLTIARRYIGGEERGENKRRKISIHGLFVYTSLRNVRRKDEEELEIWICGARWNLHKYI